MECSLRENPVFVAKLKLNIAAIKSYQGHQDLVHELCEDVLQKIKQLCEHNPSIVFAKAIHTRGEIFLRQNFFSAAMKEFEKAAKVYDRIFEGDSVEC